MNASSSIKPYRNLLLFMAAWAVVNLLQAAFTGLDGDEAYYWMFSRHLDWGYFDHPPLVALMIKMGELMGHGSLFTRLGTVLLSAGAVFFGYHCLPQHLRRVNTYILAFASVVVFHVYGFIVTPDASLFFFTAVFFYAYRRYLNNDGIGNVVWLALSIAGLLYSKYHGVLPVFFVILSNPRLLLKRSAWMAVLLAAAAFLPHLWWQYRHDWPTFRYHLSERIGSRYRIDKTTNYILGQLLVWGPFTTAPALVLFFRRQRKDAYLRAHYFNFSGILLFFLLNSFRSTIEPHWTLAGGISFLVLLLSALERAQPRLARIFQRLMVANIVLVVVARVLFVLPHTPLQGLPAFRLQAQGRSMADSVYRQAAGTPVVFVDAYTLPSLYQYYHPQESSSGYATVYSRKSYFNLSPDEPSLNGKRVFIANQLRMGESDAAVPNGYATIYLHPMDSFKAVNVLRIDWPAPAKSWRRESLLATEIVLRNPSSTPIDGRGLQISYTFIKSKKEIHTGEEKVALTDGALPPGFQKGMRLLLKAPKMPGRYRLIFSIEQSPLNGSFASGFFEVEVE